MGGPSSSTKSMSVQDDAVVRIDGEEETLPRSVADSPGDRGPKHPPISAACHRRSISDNESESSTEGGVEADTEESSIGVLVDSRARYHDYSGVRPSKTEKECPMSFPMKLHTILENPDYQHVITWMPHGR